MPTLNQSKSHSKKQFILYLLRWELSSVVLAPCLALFNNSIGVVWATIIANAIGACIFYFVDKLIFKK